MADRRIITNVRTIDLSMVASVEKVAPPAGETSAIMVTWVWGEREQLVGPKADLIWSMYNDSAR